MWSILDLGVVTISLWEVVADIIYLVDSFLALPDVGPGGSPRYICKGLRGKSRHGTSDRDFGTCVLNEGPSLCWVIDFELLS